MTGLIPGPITALDLSTPLVEEYANASRSPATRRAYAHDWQDFTIWCASHAVDHLPATSATVAAYIAGLAKQRRTMSTITRRLAAISQAHQLAGHPTPTHDERVRTVLKGIKRKVGTAQQGKAPATVEVVRILLQQIGHSILGTRDRALLLVGFAGAFRRSELVSFDVADVTLSELGIVLLLRQSKTDQEGEGRKIAIPYGLIPATCPVRALEAWLCDASVTAGPIFRPIDRHGNVKPRRLTAQSVALVIKRYAAAASLNVTDFSGHSLRAGFATTAAAVGVTERQIMRQTGHTSVKTVRKYIRQGELFGITRLARSASNSCGWPSIAGVSLLFAD
jgi:site-specific recombinase XerD